MKVDSENTSEKNVDARSITVKRMLRHENTVLATILVVLVVVLAIVTRGKSTTLQNVKNTLLQSSARGVSALGQAFVILTAGIDLSVGGLALLTSIAGARLITERPEIYHIGTPAVPIVAGVLLMLVIGGAVGSLNGLSVSRLGMPAIIVTLAMWQIARGGAYQLGGGHTIMYLPRDVAFIGQGEIGGVPVPVFIFFGAAVVSYLVLNHTIFGRSVYAVGGNPVSSYLAGIKVHGTLFSVYTISGVTAAVSGLIVLSRTMSGSMIAASGLELDTIASCAIGGLSLFGGRGTITGVVLGVIIIGIINNGMVVMQVDPTWQDIVKGLVIFAAVAVDVIRRKRS